MKKSEIQIGRIFRILSEGRPGSSSTQTMIKNNLKPYRVRFKLHPDNEDQLIYGDYDLTEELFHLFIKRGLTVTWESKTCRTWNDFAVIDTQ